MANNKDKLSAHLLSLNPFNMPMVFEDEESANYMHIIYIINLEPGTFQSHPKMGVGIRSRYRYNNDTDMLINLRNDIKRQIEDYLPQLIGVTDVTVDFTNANNTVLGIIISTNKGAYTIAYDRDADKLDAGATYLLDQLMS